MKVFLSWSGSTSKAVAQALNEWLPCVIQAVRPWMSEGGISKGARWSPTIASELEESKFGIICLTPDNTQSPWLLFEAGALSKSVTDARVCPFLVGLEPHDVEQPLGQFQATRFTREDTFKLLQSINTALDESVRLRDTSLSEGFDVWWPRLESRLSSISHKNSGATPHRTPDDMLVEILDLVREAARVRREGASKATPATASTTTDPLQDPDIRTVTSHAAQARRVLESKTLNFDTHEDIVRLACELAKADAYTEAALLAISAGYPGSSKAHDAVNELIDKTERLLSQASSPMLATILKLRKHALDSASTQLIPF